MPNLCCERRGNVATALKNTTAEYNRAFAELSGRVYCYRGKEHGKREVESSNETIV